MGLTGRSHPAGMHILVAVTRGRVAQVECGEDLNRLRDIAEKCDFDPAFDEITIWNAQGQLVYRREPSSETSGPIQSVKARLSNLGGPERLDQEGNRILHYAIYQLTNFEKDIEKVYRAFRDHDPACFDFRDYVKVYEGDLTISPDVPKEQLVTHVLDSVLWREFNVNHPADFRGHSLSVSDVVQLGDRYYYCQSIGWKMIEVADE
jgi:hypothetical protein